MESSIENKHYVILEYDNEYDYDEVAVKIPLNSNATNKDRAEPLPNIRKEFPETWIYEEFKMDDDLRLLLQRT